MAQADDREVQMSESNSDGGEIVDPSFEEAESEMDRFVDLKTNGMVEVPPEIPDYTTVKQSFLRGMGPAAERTEVLAIHRYSTAVLTTKARFDSFLIFMDAVAARHGGSANATYGWYGDTKDEICEIVARGFSLDCLNKCAEDPESHAFGIHLSPARFSLGGAALSVEDEHGLKHLLLCRVILGRSEVVPAGSKQCHPSSADFDSGVDNSLNPRKYIIWSAHMNSHIFPAYVVSFRAPCLKSLVSRSNVGLSSPSSPWVSFRTLIPEMGKGMDPPQMMLIYRSFRDFRENRISRDQLIRNLREIAGDKLLRAIINKYRQN